MSGISDGERRRVRTPCRWWIAALLVLGAIAPAGAQETEPQPLRLEARPAPHEPFPELPGAAAGSDYRIGRQDLLEVHVFDLEQLDQTVRVSDDGSISLPLLGRLVVAGMTKTALEQRIAALLEERFVRDPQVTVFVKEYESKKVAVTGAVRRPGSYEMLGRKTLLEMISLAGGLDHEVGREIIVFRSTPEGTERIPLDLERLVYGADPSLNLTIRPSDIIYVPTIETVRIFVGGEVQNPDLYEVPRSEPITLLRAITMAGGTTDRAAQKRVEIRRIDPDGKQVTLVVNVRQIRRGKIEDPILRKDDHVLVPEAFF